LDIVGFFTGFMTKIADNALTGITIVLVEAAAAVLIGLIWWWYYGQTPRA
jgi:L-aminopeptidase/D-esterase-like protein